MSDKKIPLMGCWIAKNGNIVSESLTKINKLDERLPSQRRFVQKFINQVVYPARDPNQPKLSVLQTSHYIVLTTRYQLAKDTYTYCCDL